MSRIPKHTEGSPAIALKSPSQIRIQLFRPKRFETLLQDNYSIQNFTKNKKVRGTSDWGKTKENYHTERSSVKSSAKEVALGLI